MRLASFSSHGCRTETPPTAGAGLKRGRVLSPSSSYESLESHARHASARIIQRRWRGLRRSSSGRELGELDQEPDSPFQQQAAGAVGTDLAHRPLASLPLPALTAVAAIIGAVAAGQALALEAPEVSSELETELDAVATAEAAAAAEAGLSVRSAARAQGPNLERLAMNVLLRWALMKLSSAEHVDALLASGLGTFGGAFTLGTLCGVGARALSSQLATLLKSARAGAASAPRRAGAAPALPTLTRAFGLGAVQTAALNSLEAAATSGLHLGHASVVSDGALLLSGVAAGALTAAASRPMDACLSRVRDAAKHVAREEPTAALRILLVADVAAFLALETAVARLGLDPVTTL